MVRKTKTFFSVIVPVYNVEKYLKKCVDSILGQTFPGFELILIDDGSTDGSPSICDEYARKDRRITVIHQVNCGHTEARKAGLAVAGGEYVFFVDSDDWVELDALETVRDSLEEHDADIVTFDVYYNYFDRQTVVAQSIPTGCFNQKALMKQVYPIMIYSGKFFTYGVHASMANKVFRKSIIDSNMHYVDPGIKIGEDGVATFATFLDAKLVCNLGDKCLYHCRNDNVSVTRSYCRGQFESAMLLTEVLRKMNAKKDVFDLSRQIDYYLMYHVRSVFFEEFYFKHADNLFLRCKLLKRVMNDKTVQAICKTISTDGMPRNSRLFFKFLRGKNLNMLIVLSIYSAMVMRLKNRR